jgi:hypothetical protein
MILNPISCGGPFDTAEMNTINTPGSTSPRRSSSDNQLHTPIDLGQLANHRPALSREVNLGGPTYGLYPGCLSAEPTNMPMPTPSIPELTPSPSRTFDINNISTPAPAKEAIDGLATYEYTEFPWTSEPQSMYTPDTSTLGSTPRLSKTFGMDNKSTRGNRLQKSSNPTPISANQTVANTPGTEGSSGYVSFCCLLDLRIYLFQHLLYSRDLVHQGVSQNIWQCFWL